MSVDRNVRVPKQTKGPQHWATLLTLLLWGTDMHDDFCCTAGSMPLLGFFTWTFCGMEGKHSACVFPYPL